MNLSEFLAAAPQLPRRETAADRIVLSSRVRLARNVKGFPFPGWAKKPDRLKAYELIRSTVEGLPQMSEGFAASMDALSAVERQILVERHLISREHAARSAGSGVVLSRDHSFSVMINEEDHLRMQSLRSGLELKGVWQAMDAMDSLLEQKLEYACTRELGYLTACPTNLGTGIRVSAMLHLPALVLAEQMNQVITAVNKLGLAVRGL